MSEVNLEEAVDQIRQEDPRYERAAYVFVQLALDYYRRSHQKRGSHHLTGQELLIGVQELALDQFGPLAPQVLNSWGLARGEDVGEVVYNLIRFKVMRQSKEDKQEDFAGHVVFDEAMVKGYEW